MLKMCSNPLDAAFQLAEEALSFGEVPVGCVVIYEGTTIARSRNTVNESKNASRHAEVNCIDQVLQYCKQFKLDHKLMFPQVAVFVTVEPCIMCAAMLLDLGICNVTYGCNNERFGGCGTVLDVQKCMKIQQHNWNGGVQKERAINMLKEFYMGENPSAPEGKKKYKTKKQV